MTNQPVLIDGSWMASDAIGTFHAVNPGTRQPLEEVYPVSSWGDVERCLDAAVNAADELRYRSGEDIAAFLDGFAERIEKRSSELVDMAHQETGLPESPRLSQVELPRTVGQLRQAADAARRHDWRLATIDSTANIRSGFLGLGPVAVFGPNNFPFAFGSVSGGDFASAIAAGNPVIGKANSSHPGTTRLFAEEAIEALRASALPHATVQLLYRIDHRDGERLAADPRLASIGYTGSRSAGLKLKAAADRVGKPIYLELSSINPVVVLPGAFQERGEEFVGEFSTSCLMGTGQFCTNPGLVIALDDPATRRWLEAVAAQFNTSPPGTLLSAGVESSLQHGVQQLMAAGANLLTTPGGPAKDRCSVPNALLSASGALFLAKSQQLQTEAFGNASLVVLCVDLEEMLQVISSLEGNLTGCIYSSSSGADETSYRLLEPVLRTKVGRLLNDKMPTGVAVSPAMNHGGPFPATGHPGFTAVGIPASLRRFAMLACYDAVRQDRLPTWLQDCGAHPQQWRLVDGQCTRGSLE